MERERQTDTHTDTHRETETETDRPRDGMERKLDEMSFGHRNM